MTDVRWDELREALTDLERELRGLELWSVQPPTPLQLSSIQPFSVDTLAFEQWLQWVFIPRMRAMADQSLPLPGGCQVRPMGEQTLLHLGRRQQNLLVLLGRIDRLATDLG